MLLDAIVLTECKILHNICGKLILWRHGHTSKINHEKVNGILDIANYQHHAFDFAACRNVNAIYEIDRCPFHYLYFKN